MAPGTADLIRKIERERAWTRLEAALRAVEWSGLRSRQMTRELDEWRSESGPEPGPAPAG